jgi:hypothetical protein
MQVHYLFRSRNLFFYIGGARSARIAGITVIIFIIIVTEKKSISQNTAFRQEFMCLADRHVPLLHTWTPLLNIVMFGLIQTLYNILLKHNGMTRIKITVTTVM